MAGDAEQLGQVHVEKAQKGLSPQVPVASAPSRRRRLTVPLGLVFPPVCAPAGERALPEGHPSIPAGPSLALPHRGQSEEGAEQGQVPGRPQGLLNLAALSLAFFKADSSSVLSFGPRSWTASRATRSGSTSSSGICTGSSPSTRCLRPEEVTGETGRSPGAEFLN